MSVGFVDPAPVGLTSNTTRYRFGVLEVEVAADALDVVAVVWVVVFVEFDAVEADVVLEDEVILVTTEEEFVTVCELLVVVVFEAEVADDVTTAVTGCGLLAVVFEADVVAELVTESELALVVVETEVVELLTVPVSEDTVEVALSNGPAWPREKPCEGASAFT